MGRNRQEAKRLRVLSTWISILLLIIVARLFQLQVIKHDSFLARAENQWSKSIVLPADRGTIYDRNGKTVARSVTRWRLGFATRQISNPAELIRSLSEFVDIPVDLESRIQKANGKHIVFANKVVLHPDNVNKIKKLKGVTIEEQRSRIYPYGGVGASLLGFSQQDADGAYHCEGLESSLNNVLAGVNGIGSRIVHAAGSDYGYEIIKEPVVGESVTLSIDIEIQTICENMLSRFIAESRAAGGSVLVVDPSTGDILAAADSPVVRFRSDCPDSLYLWNNYNFTGAYEPGSVFKVFTTSILLKRNAVKVETIFDCDDGNFGKFTIRNSSGHDDLGELPLLDAFSHSSNIYFARAVANISKKEFYRDMKVFGFGLPTGIRYPGAATGSLALPEDWSGRSKPTIAIGQELLVSPLQIVTAGSVIANNGVMVKPGLVKKLGQKVITAADGRRVISKNEAAIVKRGMALAVESGTGSKAQVNWTLVAGKTGTAQKSKPGARGYLPGKYVTSFLGMAPVEEPRVLILTTIDEPDYAHHYASNSAAPLFAAIVNEMGRSTDWFDGVASSEYIVAKSNMIEVPDIRYITTVTAQQMINSSGLTLSGNNTRGLVIAQNPTPGTRISKGSPVTITVAIEDGQDSIVIPDLHGMSNREIKQYANSLQIETIIHGTGYVVRQKPSPNKILDGHKLELWMENRWH